MNNQLHQAVRDLKRQKNAVILAHNYQIPEVQDVADYLGGSLQLSHKAAEIDAERIVFCGVHFMAETASIISPDKKVLIPDPEAGCSLADSINVEQLSQWKAEHPEAVVVSYVNTTAAVKAESDYCCTSSNAVQVIDSIPEETPILFLPDKYLGGYIEMVTGRDLIIWDGECHVHEKIGETNLSELEKEHRDAEVLIHPECGCSTSCMMKSAMYDGCRDSRIFSTGQMIDYVDESDSDKFIIATETGILHRMQKNHPNKHFIPANENSVCEFMKMITLEKVYNSLMHDRYEVKVSDELARKARIPIERMLEIA